MHKSPKDPNPMACPFSSSQSRQPVFPSPLPADQGFLTRVLKGTDSWLKVLHPQDFLNPIGSVKFFGQHIFLVNAAREVKRLMVDDVGHYPKHHFILWILEPLIGRAVFSVNGSEWARQRRLVDQAFKLASLRRIYPDMKAAVIDMVERLRVVADGRSLAIDEEMTLVTGDVIVRAIVSRPMQGEEAAAIFQSFTRYQQRAGIACMLRLLRLPQKWLQRYAAQYARPIRDWIRLAVEERLHENQVRPDGQSPPSDLLQALIEAVDQETETKFSTTELVNQVCTLFLAGHETSASSLSMAIYLLAQYPDCQQRIWQEVSGILNQRSAHEGSPEMPLEYSELRQLPYCAALFNETLRLYPPIIFLIRESAKHDSILGSICPAGAMVAISPWVIQRHEKHWDHPNEFRPGRFMDDLATVAEKQLESDAFLPFGIGPRKCPGAAFAMQEAVLVLAEMVRNFEILPDKNHTPDLVGRLTLRSRNGVKVRLVPRRWEPQG